MSEKALREGFTTGSAAAAAAMAALEVLLHAPAPPFVRVPLPPFADGPSGWLDVPVRAARRMSGGGAAAVAIKDGGDDPDVTHGAAVAARVRTASGDISADEDIVLLGGEGVGRVTLPGLPVPVGEAAINPAPRAQIRYGLRLAAARHGYGAGLHVIISVPLGRRLARRTLNPRLGIVGGISILGTQGTVRPYSHDAWKMAVLQGLDVAAATGCDTLCLSTGRRSERLLLALYPHVPPQAAVQAADFAEFSLREAGARPFRHLVWGCFFGKLVKLAQGNASTHARDADLDFHLLARWCAGAGVPEALLARCVTAGHVLDLLLETGPPGLAAVRGVALRAARAARTFAGRPVTIHVFHVNGQEVARV